MYLAPPQLWAHVTQSRKTGPGTRKSSLPGSERTGLKLGELQDGSASLVTHSVRASWLPGDVPSLLANSRSVVSFPELEFNEFGDADHPIRTRRVMNATGKLVLNMFILDSFLYKVLQIRDLGSLTGPSVLAQPCSRPQNSLAAVRKTARPSELLSASTGRLKSGLLSPIFVCCEQDIGSRHECQETPSAADHARPDGEHGPGVQRRARGLKPPSTRSSGPAYPRTTLVSSDIPQWHCQKAVSAKAYMTPASPRFMSMNDSSNCRRNWPSCSAC